MLHITWWSVVELLVSEEADVVDLKKLQFLAIMHLKWNLSPWATNGGLMCLNACYFYSVRKQDKVYEKCSLKI